MNHVLLAALCFLFLSCQRRPSSQFASATAHAEEPTVAVSHSETDEFFSSDGELTQEDFDRVTPDASKTTEKTMLLKRYSYVTAYNPETRCPAWVGWTLTAAHTDGPYPRLKKFLEDKDVPQPRALYSDIRESRCGYQRGHMCPAADNKWAEQAQHDAFLMTNICPQDGDLNQNDWEELEEKCRDWAKAYGKVHIVAGPIFIHQPRRTVGENHVAVPDAFFKVVLVGEGSKAKAIGFFYENEDGRHPMSHYVRSVDEIEDFTRLDFFHHLDDETENRIEARSDLRDWR